jgi:hypothetical protein
MYRKKADAGNDPEHIAADDEPRSEAGAGCCESRPRHECGNRKQAQSGAPSIANLPASRAHLLSRLRRQIDPTLVPVLNEVLREISANRGALQDRARRRSAFFFQHHDLAVESFFAADAATAQFVRRRSPSGASLPEVA